MPMKMVLGGHDAKPGTQEDLRRLHDYFKATWESVQEAHEEGLSLEQIKKQCSLDCEMTCFRAVLDVENLGEIHDYNIELIVQRLSR